MKVGDKVCARINCNTCEGVVVYPNEKDNHKPCLVVFKDSAGDDFSRWLNYSDLQLMPKFKLHQVWEMRDGDHGEIVSISSRNMLVVHSKNSDAHGIVGLELNGRYYEAGEESDYDLVRQVR